MAKTPLSFTYTCPNCECKTTFSFQPGRPAPPCSNHDSPAFSDTGDDEEMWCDEDDCPQCGEPITDDQLSLQGNAQLEVLISNEADYLDIEDSRYET